MTATREGATHAHAGTSATEKRGMNLTLRIWRQKDPTVKEWQRAQKLAELEKE